MIELVGFLVGVGGFATGLYFGVTGNITTNKLRVQIQGIQADKEKLELLHKKIKSKLPKTERHLYLDI